MTYVPPRPDGAEEEDALAGALDVLQAQLAVYEAPQPRAVIQQQPFSSFYHS